MANTEFYALSTWEKQKENFTHFGIGQPQRELLPTVLMQRASEDLFQKINQGGFDERYLLQYGASQGDVPFRQELAKYLSESFQYDVDPKTLFITNGNSHAVESITAEFTKPGDSVLVEQPTYLFAFGMLRNAGCELLPAHQDDHGLDVDGLEKMLDERRRQGLSMPKLLYTVPSFGNPVGLTLSHDRRQKLVRLAQKHNFLIVSDEVYQQLYFREDAIPPPPMIKYGIDNNCPDLVLSLGTFSKILAPALKTGWIESGPETIQRLMRRGVFTSGGGVAPFSSCFILTAFCNGSFKEYLNFLRSEYARRANAMVEEIRTASSSLPDHARCDIVHVPQGGYFLWIRLPDALKMRAVDLSQIARSSYGVDFFTGESFMFDHDPQFDRFIRLSFAFFSEEQVRSGTRKLMQCIADNCTAP